MFATGLDQPRTLRTAPNGDIFVAESRRRPNPRAACCRRNGQAGASRHLRLRPRTCRSGLPSGRPGPSPQFLYVGETGRVVRYPYQSGDLQARGPAQVVVAACPMAAIGPATSSSRPTAAGCSSRSDRRAIWRDLTGQPPAGLPLGAAWGDDLNRAAVLEFSPEGGDGDIFATGLRNCSAEAIQPGTGALWCVVNERDGLGDNLPPDYATQVRAGRVLRLAVVLYRQPSGAADERRARDLAGRVTVPDVLIQPHSAPLGIAFYDGAQFPPAYRGNAFVALHGSWNRAQRTGYKVVRLRSRTAVRPAPMRIS